MVVALNPGADCSREAWGGRPSLDGEARIWSLMGGIVRFKAGSPEPEHHDYLWGLALLRLADVN